MGILDLNRSWLSLACVGPPVRVTKYKTLADHSLAPFIGVTFWLVYWHPEKIDTVLGQLSLLCSGVCPHGSDHIIQYDIQHSSST
jgi:hypothetical protein